MSKPLPDSEPTDIPDVVYEWMPVCNPPRPGLIVVGLTIRNGHWHRRGLMRMIGASFWRVGGNPTRITPTPTHWRYREGDPKVPVIKGTS